MTEHSEQAKSAYPDDLRDPEVLGAGSMSTYRNDALRTAFDRGRESKQHTDREALAAFIWENSGKLDPRRAGQFMEAGFTRENVAALADAILAAPSLSLVAAPRVIELVEQIGSHVASEYDDDPHLDRMIGELRALPIKSSSEVEAAIADEIEQSERHGKFDTVAEVVAFIRANARVRSGKAEA